MSLNFFIHKNNNIINSYGGCVASKTNGEVVIDCTKLEIFEWMLHPLIDIGFWSTRIKF